SVKSGFYEVALTPRAPGPFSHATSQTPKDSRIDRGMIQDGKLRGFAMSQAIPVRTNYTAGEVRRFAQRAKDAAQARRLLAIAADARRCLAGRGGHDRWQGSSDAAGLGDPVQRAGTGRSHQYPFSGSAAQAQLQAQGLSRPDRR